MTHSYAAKSLGWLTGTAGESPPQHTQLIM